MLQRFTGIIVSQGSNEVFAFRRPSRFEIDSHEIRRFCGISRQQPRVFMSGSCGASYLHEQRHYQQEP